MPGTDPSSPPVAPLPQLRQILEEARAAGFLGPGPLDTHLRHAEGFVALCRRLWSDGPTPPLLLDLGSGGGLPGLVVAARRPRATVILLDAQRRRTAFLSDAVRRLGFGARVSVRQDRAEAAGRDPDLRGHIDGVLARSFGPPSVVAECAAPLLRPGGWLVVSEPPGDSPTDVPELPADPAGPTRWPPGPLRQLGLVPDELAHEEFGYQLLRQEYPCPDRFPRRNGVPAKRPLF